MSLADCLGKIQLDADDVAAIQTAVEQKVAGGMDRVAAEKAAAAEHLRAVQADVEDVRKQLGAPKPVEVAAQAPAEELPTVTGAAPADDTAGPAMDQAIDQLNQAGLPQDAENAQKISAITRRLQKMADEGMPARFWYELSGEAIFEAAGRNKGEADKIAQLMAVYSPQNKVYPNAWMAIKAYNQAKAGKPIKAGRFTAQDVQAEKVMKGEKIYFTQAEFETLPKKDQARAKTSNFYTNLVAQFDPQRQQGVTVDMWMMRAFGYDNDNPTLAQYNFVQEKVAQLAEKLGWKPHQVQAAVWTSIKSRWEAVAPAATEKYKAAGKMTLDEKSGKLVFTEKADEKAYRVEVLKKALDVDLPKITEAGFNFADGMKRASANLSVETRPGVKSGVLPGMSKASYAEQLEYDQAIKQALTNPETGGDRIAELLGMPSLARIFTPGAWLDQTNPSTQIQVPVGMTGSKDPGFDKKLPKIDAASREQLDAYSAIYGLLTSQDAVGWHRPFFVDETAMAVKDANGVRLEVGRTLTPEETAAFAQRIGKDHGGAIAVVGDEKGVRLLNFSGLSNVEFHKYAGQIAGEILADGEVKLARFYADSNLVESSNEGENYGEGYRRRLGEAGRSDVLGAAEAELAPRIAAVNRRFSEAYGWGDPGAQPEGGVLTSLQQSGLKKPKGDGLPRTIKDAVAAGKPFELIHWSTTEGLKSLDPKYAGTAGAGAERAAYQDGARKRTHFGLLGRYRLEDTVASAAKTAYRITVDPKDVYDLYADPQGFVKGAKTLQAGLDAARKAGFKFFYSSQTGPWAPYLFTNDKVDGLKEIPAEQRPGLMRPAMPKPTKAEEQAYKYGQSPVSVVGQEQLGDNFDERRAFFQDQKSKPRGGLTLVDGKYVVELFDGADLSTVLHETGHIFLEELKGIVASGMASEQAVKDWDTLATWLGNEGEAVTRPQHEKFASAFETYLLEGKAPNAKLSEAFGTFRRWLTRIYERVVTGDPAAGINNLLKTEYGVEVSLTDDVREVFDRLLTIEHEALAETVAQDFAVPPASKGEDDKGKASRTRIADLLAKAQEHLEERLFAKRTGLVAAQKKVWREEATAALSSAPVYKARADLEANGLLDADAVRAAHGDKAVLQLRAKGLVTEDGVQGQEPGIVAAKAGFNTGAEMVAQLKEFPSLEYAVRQVVKTKANAAWQAYTAADAMADVPEYQQALDAGATYLGQILGRRPLGHQQIKDLAIKAMESMPVREATRPDVFLANSSRLQRQEKQALAKGDLEVALEKNQKARVQWELARMAKRNKEQVAAILDRAARLKASDGSKIDQQYWHAALELAAKHGLIDMPVMTPPREGWKNLTALFVERLDPASEEYDGGMDVRAMASSPIISGSDTRDYKDMPVVDLAEVDHVLRFLEHDGRERVKQEILDGQRKLDETATALVGLMVKNVKPLSPKNEFAFLRPLADYKDKFIAGLRMWQFVARAIDGTPTSDTGLASQVLQNTLNGASDSVHRARVKIDKTLKPIYEYLGKRVQESPQYLDVGVPVTDAMKQNGMDGWTFERVFTAALNMGNTYNLEGLARGYGLVTAEGEVDRAALMKITSALTEKDWQLVQKVWDTIEGELRDPLATAYEQVTGTPMAIVHADPISVQTAEGGTLELRGGYYPIKFDPRLSITVAERAEADELTLRAQTMAPIIATRSGMTKSRTNTGGRAFDLRLHVLDTHIDDTLQYIHYRQLLKDLNKLTRHQAFKEAFIQHFGQPSWFELRKYLADIGLPNIEPQDVITRTVNGFRSHAAPWLLSYNLNSILKQVPQVITAFADRPGAFFTGTSEMLREGIVASSRSMREKSEYLAFRAEAVDRDAAYFMKQVDPLGRKKTRKVAELGMSLFAMADHVLVAPFWKGEYSAKYNEYVKTMSPAEAEKAAKRDADNYVRGTMPGSFRAMDQNGWLRSRSGLARMFTLFASPGFHFANRQILMYNAMRGGQLGVGEYFGHVLAEGVVAPLMIPMALALMWGGWPPDDEKWKELGAEAFAYQFSGIPMLRELIATQTRPGRSFSEQLPAFAGFDLVARSTSALWHLPLELEDPKRQEKALLAVADLLSFYYQIPASRIVEKTLEGWRQMEKLDNGNDPFAYVEDMLTVLFPDPDKRQR